MKLNAYISSASDGLFTVKTLQLPELTAHAGTIDDIPHAVRCAAAAICGQPPEDFEIITDF